MPYLSIVAFAFGAGCGSVSRFLVAMDMAGSLGSLLSSRSLCLHVFFLLALGWLETVFLDRPEINVALRLGIAVGLLGVLTTFSTFSFESVQILLNGAAWRDVLNVTVNFVVCLGMCYLGMQLARLS